jgi:hypothetical protein
VDRAYTGPPQALRRGGSGDGSAAAQPALRPSPARFEHLSAQHRPGAAEDMTPRHDQAEGFEAGLVVVKTSAPPPPPDASVPRWPASRRPRRRKSNHERILLSLGALALRAATFVAALVEVDLNNRPLTGADAEARRRLP